MQYNTAIPGPASEGVTNSNPPPRPQSKRCTKKALGVQVGHVFIPIWRSVCRGRILYQVSKPRVPGGRRKLATFSTLADAEDYARSLAKGGAQLQEVFARVTADALKETALVADLLKPFVTKLGITLEQAVREYCAAKEIAGKQCLAVLVKDYLVQPGWP